MWSRGSGRLQALPEGLGRSGAFVRFVESNCPMRVGFATFSAPPCLGRSNFFDWTLSTGATRSQPCFLDPWFGYEACDRSSHPNNLPDDGHDGEPVASREETDPGLRADPASFPPSPLFPRHAPESTRRTTLKIGHSARFGLALLSDLPSIRLVGESTLTVPKLVLLSS